jgi:hypothetical protein
VEKFIEVLRHKIDTQSLKGETLKEDLAILDSRLRIAKTEESRLRKAKFAIESNLIAQNKLSAEQAQNIADERHHMEVKVQKLEQDCQDKARELEQLQQEIAEE